MGSEWLLMTMLATYQARVARFAAVAAAVFLGEANPDQAKYPFRIEMQNGYVAKHSGEAGTASLNACLLKRGMGCLDSSFSSRDDPAWAWQIGEQATLDPPCFQDDKLLGQLICKFGSGVADFKDLQHDASFNAAWDSVYTFSRCCN